VRAEIGVLAATRYWLYRLIRATKHRFGLHDWRERGIPGASDGIHVSLHEHCDWCGASRQSRRNRR
jgi:hypothetical protein